MRANRPIKMVSKATGGTLRTFINATDAASELKVAKSTIYQMMMGILGSSKSYRLEYTNGPTAESSVNYKGTTHTVKTFKEIEGYHHTFNKATAKERTCMMCEQKFLSSWSGNRRCAQCSCKLAGP